LGGVTNFAEFAHDDPINPDPGLDYDKYIIENSQTWLWDADARSERVLLEHESGTLLTNGSGDTLVVCEPTSKDDDPLQDRWQHTIAHVYSMPSGKLSGTTAARTGQHMRGQYFGGPILAHPVFGSAGARAFLVTGTTQGPARYGGRGTVGIDAVVLAGLDGSVKFLTEGTANRLVRYLPGLPAVLTLEDGELAVACMLERWGAMPWRLALFGMDGERIREYSFGLRYGIVEKFTGETTNWRPITVTPDGGWLLLHDTGEGGHLRSGEDGWLWMWNLEEKTGRPVARLRQITAVYGWVHDEYLLVQLQRPEGSPVDDHGALYVPWKSQAGEAEARETRRPEE
jgi:hypothetical protein